MGMPQYDFSKPMTFLNALAQFSLALNCVMVALRDEANFHDAQDEKILSAANLFLSLLDDSHSEAVKLVSQLERRVLGMV